MPPPLTSAPDLVGIQPRCRHALGRLASARGETIEWQEVDRLRSGVRLRLNPKGRGAAPTGVDKHPLDRLIHADLDALGQTGPAGTGQHDGIADWLELHMADLLKQEWDGSKDKAVTGKLKGG